ncbi:MAG: kinase [Pseudonocardiales bacterium]|nr:MAG: kinase [Pseudonocardiales bacterium]
MVPIAIPANLAANAAGSDEPDLRDWVAGLPRVVAETAARWALRLGEPFQPGGGCSWVAPARDHAGRDLVLKVGWRHPEALHEADGLALWAGDGAVRLYAAHTFAETTVLLIERCRPGTTLSRVVAEPEQDAVVAGLLRRLWREPPPGHSFRALQVMCDQWAAGFQRRLSATPGSVDAGLARAGLALWRALPASAGSSVVLCTDLHAENILAAQREPWLVCDPKPYVGDPAYDALQHMLNCTERLVADPAGFARRMAELLDLDTDRLTRWLFARCVMDAPENAELREVAARLAP